MNFEIFVDDDCVWPGDMDKNGLVNNLDVLYNGMSLNETGPIRYDASLEFIGQPARNFVGEVQGINAKHADSDGNGVVNESDIEAIELNYGLQQDGLSPSAEEAPSIFIDGPTAILQDLPFSFTVQAGNENNSLENVYGMAFSIYLNGNYSNVDMDFSNSIFEDAGDYESFVQKFQDRIDIAIYMKNPSSIGAASGEIVRGNTIMVVDNVDDPDDNLQEFSINVGNISLLDASYSPLEIGGQLNPGGTVQAFSTENTPIFAAGENQVQACDDESVFLFATQDLTRYEWFWEGQILLNENDPWLNTRGSGNFEVRMFNENDNLEGSMEFEVERLKINEPELHYQNEFLVCPDIAHKYNWYFNGTVISSGDQTTILPELEGYYAIEVENAIGCSAISRNFLFSQDSMYVNTSVDELITTTAANLYPNPTTDLFTLEIPEFAAGKFSCRLEDVSGNVIRTWIPKDKTEQLSMAQAPAGMYFLHIESEDRIETKKMMLIR